MESSAEPSPQAKAMAVLVSKDMEATRGEYLFSMPSNLGLLNLINDPRDAPSVYLIVNVLLVTVPTAIVTALCASSHWQGAAYLIFNYVLFIQRFMLASHVTHHRRLFKLEYNYLNGILPYFLSPLFGIPPGLYRIHHVVMHHAGDNRGVVDLSSTEPYQRDNLKHFFHYWVRFSVLAWFELPIYVARNKRKDLLPVTLGGEVGYWLLFALLWRYNWVGALWAMLIPFAISSIFLMFGNWSQHVFVDPNGTHDVYRSTYNSIACKDNRMTYNDGYHIIHHLSQMTHWSDVPPVLLKTLDEHDAHDALVFHTLGFFDIGFAVFGGKLDYIAQHIVPCGPRQASRTHAQWVEVLRERLRPISDQSVRGKPKKAP